MLIFIKIRSAGLKDDLGGTVPPIKKIVYSLRTKTYTGFELINLIYILVKQFVLLILYEIYY